VNGRFLLVRELYSFPSLIDIFDGPKVASFRLITGLGLTFLGELEAENLVN
jgi:hypothetical protein